MSGSLHLHEDPVNESRFQPGSKLDGKEANHSLSGNITKLKASPRPKKGLSSLKGLDSKSHLLLATEEK